MSKHNAFNFRFDEGVICLSRSDLKDKKEVASSRINYNKFIHVSNGNLSCNGNSNESFLLTQVCYNLTEDPDFESQVCHLEKQTINLYPM